MSRLPLAKSTAHCLPLTAHFFSTGPGAGSLPVHERRGAVGQRGDPIHRSPGWRAEGRGHLRRATAALGVRQSAWPARPMAARPPVDRLRLVRPQDGYPVQQPENHAVHRAIRPGRGGVRRAGGRLQFVQRVFPSQTQSRRAAGQRRRRLGGLPGGRTAPRVRRHNRRDKFFRQGPVV